MSLAVRRLLSACALLALVAGITFLIIGPWWVGALCVLAFIAIIAFTVRDLFASGRIYEAMEQQASDKR